MSWIPLDNIELLPLASHYYNSYVLTEKASTSRVISQYEIDIFTRGTANLTIDGCFHRYQKGDICFRRPGQLNQQDIDSPYECIFFYFHVLKKDTGEKLLHTSPYNHFLLNLPNIIPRENCTEIKETIFRLYQHLFFHSEYDNLICKTMLSLLTAQLYKISLKDQPQSLLKHHPAIRKSIDYIHSHLSCPLRIEDVANQCGLSTKYFHQIFKESTGKTPNSFILEQKMNLAKEKLISTATPIEDIAYECGFNSSSYFIRTFKQFFQKTPAEFRKKMN